jgi:copper transport protein
MSTLRRVLLPTWLALALALVPLAAAAHSELVSSIPAANASLPKSPAELSLTFSEAVDIASSHVDLLDSSQATVPGLGSLSANADSTTVTVSVPTLKRGVYTVSYQVTSAVDGHVTSGIYAFLVDPTGAQPPPSVPTQSTSPSSDPDVVATRWLALAAMLALFGTALFWLVSARPALSPEHRTTPWGAMAISGALAFGGQALYLNLAARPLVAAVGHAGHSATTGFPLDPAGPFGWTPFAIAMRIALAGSVVAFALATWHWARGDEARRRGRLLGEHRDGVWLAVVGVAAAVALAGTSLGGHAAAIGGPVNAVFDWLHLAAVGAWLGTLPGLLLLALRLRGAGPGGGSLRAALRRHSRVAFVAAPIVAATGLANSPLVLGSSRELVASGYGDLLLAKSVLFSVAIGIGSANFFLVRGGTFRRSLPLIATELVVGALAVLAAAGMTTGQPGANRPPTLVSSAVGTAHLYGTAGESTVHVAVDRAEPGDQRYQVSVANATSGAVRTDVQRVYLLFTPPAKSGLPPERVQLTAGNDAGLWSTRGAYTPIVGDWKLGVIVRRVGLLDETTSFDLPVREPVPAQVVPPADTGVGVPVPLAAAWAALPEGIASWAVPLLLLAVALLLGLAVRVGVRGRRIVNVARLLAVLLAVVIGLGVASRAAVQAANEPSASDAAAANPVPRDADSVARGKQLYLANCAACHGVDGSGGGPALVTTGEAAEPLSQVVPELSDGTIAYRIAVGTVVTRMPGFAGTLSPNDRWDLVNYLRATWPGTDR